VLKGDDKEAIEKKTEALTAAAAGIAQKAYAEAGGQAGATGEAGGAQAEGGGAAGKDDVVDAEFEEVKDKGRRAS
jgi:molecular chaperone DnaK